MNQSSREYNHQTYGKVEYESGVIWSEMVRNTRLANEELDQSRTWDRTDRQNLLNEIAMEISGYNERAVEIANRRRYVNSVRWTQQALHVNAPKESELTPENDNICKVCGRSEYYGTATFTTIKGGDTCDDCL